MKSKFTSFVMKIMIILLILILAFIGKIVYDEFIASNITAEVQEFVSNITIDSSKFLQDVQTPQILQIESTEETINENIDYTDIKIDKHFYSQLDEYSKIIYNAMEANKENMKTGTYEINLGTEFSKLLEKDNGEELLGSYYQSAIEAYSYDNPEIFYIDFTKLYLNIETTTRGKNKTYKVLINSGQENNYLTNDFYTKDEINIALNQLENVKEYFIQNNKGDTYSNIKSVHDYLVESIDYDETISLQHIYNIYGAIVNKKCVCEGYAKAFKFIMDGLNIPTVVVSGTGTNSYGESENHAWNYVQVNGIWYAIDCTWDDPIIIGGGVLSNKSKYKYFLKGESEFNQTHTPNGKFTQNGMTFKYPNLSASNY